MKERPILMTPENAQGCFEGTKTQTRRIVKPQPTFRRELDVHIKYGFDCQVNGANRDNCHFTLFNSEECKDAWEFGNKIKCPYGAVGDLLYVRESFWCPDSKNPIPHDSPYMFYRGNQRDPHEKGVSWKPSIHMPRWACRTVLRITDVRVQRLQEISLDDCIAEGIVPDNWDSHDPHQWHNGKGLFEELWESINGKGSWALDPLVWALTFEKVTE